jgi:hypothetical protein
MGGSTVRKCTFSPYSRGMSILVRDETDTVPIEHSEIDRQDFPPAPEPHDVDPPASDYLDGLDDGHRDVQVHFTKTPDIELLHTLMERHGFEYAQDVVRSAVAFYAWVSDQEEMGDRFQIARRRGVDTYELIRPKRDETDPPPAANVKPRRS